MNNVKILIADDSHYFLNLHGTFLERSCCRILKARNGEEALYLIQSEQPQLVIMDLTMPVMGGQECCRLMRTHSVMKDIPVIMVTTEWARLDRKGCGDCDGCDDVIVKPINRARLMAAVRRFVPMAERRYDRIPCTRPVTCRWEGHDFEGVIDNISEGGLYIRTIDPLAADTVVGLSFRLFQHGDLIEGFGRVKWIIAYGGEERPGAPRGMGIEFMSLGERERQTVKNYIKMKAKD